MVGFSALKRSKIQRTSGFLNGPTFGEREEGYPALQRCDRIFGKNPGSIEAISDGAVALWNQCRCEATGLLYLASMDGGIFSIAFNPICLTLDVHDKQLDNCRIYQCPMSIIFWFLKLNRTTHLLVSHSKIMRRKKIMPDSERFHSYVGSYLHGLGQATVIITVDTEAKPLAYSEYFAFLENGDSIYDELRITCDTSGVPKNIAEFDLSTIVDDAVSQAEQNLSRLLRDRYKNYIHDNSLSKLIELSPSDNGPIFRLIMRNKFSEKIDRVIAKTKSNKLRDFLSEHKSLPKLVYHKSLK